MKESEFKDLRANAAAYAKEHGVDAYLDMEEMEKSQVHVGGVRIRLFVAREMPEGEAPKRWDQTPDYAPDTKDIWDRLKKDIRAGARALYKAN